MRVIPKLLAVIAIAACSSAVQAAETPADFWTTPTVHGYGKIHYLPDASYRPQADQDYRIVFSITQASKSPESVNVALDHVARTVNLYTEVFIF